MFSIKTAVIAATMVVGTGAHAATFNEVGDFGDTNFGTFFLGTVSGETVTIAGSISTTCVASSSRFADCSGGDQSDRFSFATATGAVASNFNLTISNLTRTDIFGLSVRLNDRSFGANGTTGVQDTFAFRNFLGGQQTFFVGASSSTSISGAQGIGDISFDYEITFDVSAGTPPISAVPLPASSFLLVAGLAGLGAMRRRKKG